MAGSGFANMILSVVGRGKGMVAMGHAAQQPIKSYRVSQIRKIQYEMESSHYWRPF